MKKFNNKNKSKKKNKVKGNNAKNFTEEEIKRAIAISLADKDNVQQEELAAGPDNTKVRHKGSNSNKRDRNNSKKNNNQQTIRKLRSNLKKLQKKTNLMEKEIGNLGGISKLKRMTNALGNQAAMRRSNSNSDDFDEYFYEELKETGDRLRKPKKCQICLSSYPPSQLAYCMGSKYRICVTCFPRFVNQGINFNDEGDIVCPSVKDDLDNFPTDKTMIWEHLKPQLSQDTIKKITAQKISKIQNKVVKVAKKEKNNALEQQRKNLIREFRENHEKFLIIEGIRLLESKILNDRKIRSLIECPECDGGYMYDGGCGAMRHNPPGCGTEFCIYCKQSFGKDAPRHGIDYGHIHLQDEVRAFPNSQRALEKYRNRTGKELPRMCQEAKDYGKWAQHNQLPLERGHNRPPDLLWPSGVHGQFKDTFKKYEAWIAANRIRELILSYEDENIKRHFVYLLRKGHKSVKNILDYFKATYDLRDPRYRITIDSFRDIPDPENAEIHGIEGRPAAPANNRIYDEVLSLNRDILIHIVIPIIKQLYPIYFNRHTRQDKYIEIIEDNYYKIIEDYNQHLIELLEDHGNAQKALDYILQQLDDKYIDDYPEPWRQIIIAINKIFKETLDLN